MDVLELPCICVEVADEIEVELEDTGTATIGRYGGGEDMLTVAGEGDTAAP